ncbi:MAG: SURF1 family protein [Betaproteobacteria bacterium]
MSASLRYAVLLLMALAAFALAVALGNWQRGRAAEKLAVEAQWDRAEQTSPRAVVSGALPAVADLPLRVSLRGTFDHARSVWLDNRPLDSRPGFWVITPLQLDGGAVVLVNRGWVARDANDRARLPRIGQPDGEQRIEGLAITHAPRLLELGEGGNAASLPAIWQNLDYANYEATSGLRVAPLVVLQTSAQDDGLTRRWVRPASGVDKHRGYAFQWYALAALIAVLTVFFSARTWHRRRAQHRPD